MIYTTKITVTADTKTRKLVIVTGEGKRIAITRSTRTSHDVQVVIDDRYDGAFNTAAELLGVLAQTLYGAKEVRRLAKETTNVSTS